MDEITNAIYRLEGKIDTNFVSVTGKIDALGDRLDLKIENTMGKIVAGDNDTMATVKIYAERQVGLTSRIENLEGSLRRAYALVAGLAVTVIAGVLTTLIQIH